MKEVRLVPIQKVEEETVKLVLDIYQEACIKIYYYGPPEIEYIYREVKERWLSETYDYLCTNEDALEINMKDITLDNLIPHMHEQGYKDFVIPSYDKVYRILNFFEFAYVSSQQIINDAVVDVW